MTRLAILWHMHQPYYEDLATGEHILPWVRLHALKDYWGMAALLREFPDVRVTFNLVPSLLVQIQAFAEDRAHDRHLIVGLKPATELDAGEREFLVANGFHAPVDRMIRPYPRYAELHTRRHRPEGFSVEDVRDLQVLVKLAWMDPDWLAGDERLRRLVGKERGYGEDDKRILRDVELELLRAVIPAYRERAEAGQIELSTSPFYHPILPLLCDTDTHLRAHPHSPIPRQLFARPADAEAQLRRALAFHADLFGAAPAGVWPSEGSLSEDTLALLAAEGVQWTATDEELLVRSLHHAVQAEALYRPYSPASASSVRCLFRDHGLSDAIGFVYQSWEPAVAADDFLHRVREAGRRFRATLPSGVDESPIVTVILDGENAWEHYAGGGRPFLRALYRRLSDASDIQTVSMADAARTGEARPLEVIFPGSWINADFYIWAGHADDHRAWGQLARARTAYEAATDVAGALRMRAYEELLIAEGSDWFWWYGDDHSSDQDREFDDLFRRHLRNAYAALGLPTPDDLFVSNISTEPHAGPMAFRELSSPVVDGRITDFGEWSRSAIVSLDEVGGTMHRVSSRLIREFRLAADGAFLYLRLDGAQLVRGLQSGDLGLTLVFGGPDAERRLELAKDLHWRADEVVEMAVPFDAIAGQPGGRIRLSVLVTEGAQTVERQPSAGPVDLEIPSRDLNAINWVV